MTEPKKRGRKPGSKTGPRTMIFIMMSVKNGSLVEYKYTTNDPELSTESKAKDEFHIKYGFLPEKIYGPFYDVKGTSKTPIVETKSLDNPEMEEVFGTVKVDDWIGTAFKIKNSDKLYFIPIKEAVATGKKQPMNKIISLAQAQIQAEIS